MNPLDILFGQVANAVKQHSSSDTPGPEYDANPILNALSGVFTQQAQNSGQQFSGYDPNGQYDNQVESNGPDLGGLLGGLLGGGAAGSVLGGLLGGDNNQNQGQMGNVRSASEDPYGDPADTGSQGGFAGNVRPASEDPYDDPADAGSNSGFGANVRPASEDPYGDPADR
jgi:hypothetical protein